MVRSRSSILIICMLICSFVTEGQVNRYMVFLTDKNGSPYSTLNPEEFLSTRAIERRQNQAISITTEDLPVNPSYITQISDLGVETFFASRWLNAVLVQTVVDNLEAIESLSFVERIELVATGEKLLTEPIASGRIKMASSRLKTTHETKAQNSMLSVPQMHLRDFQGQGIMVAVFDGGFEGVDQANQFQHIFEDDRMIATYDFVANSGEIYQYDDHGTRVFSAIGAYSEEDFIGTAHQASFILCVTEDVSSESRIEEYNWLFATEFADSVGVDIINTSVGYNLFDNPFTDYTHDDLDGETAVITQAANIAGQKGIFLVVSAGNEGNNSWEKVTPPADSPYVLTVGSITDQGDLSSFSSIGPTADDRLKPDVVALGTRVTLVGSSGNVTTGNGTSFSAPLVSGLAAGVWQANPTLTNMELIEAIKQSADNADNPDNSFGYGVPDFLKAVDNPVLSVDDILRGRIKVYPNPFRDNKIFIDLDSEITFSELSIEFFNLSGVLLAQQTIFQHFGQDRIEFAIDNELVAGTYVLRVRNKKQVTEVKLLKF